MATSDEMLGKLKEAGVEMKLEKHGAAMTVDEWAPMHEKFGGESVLTRCLFMKDKKKQLFLLVTLASTRTDLKVFSKAVGSKEPRFANEEVLDEKLKVKKGAVNPFAIINDTSSDVTLVLEDALVKSKAPLCFHPMDNTQTVVLSNTELIKFFDHHNIKYQVADLTVDPAAAAAAAAPKKKEQKPKPAKKEKSKPVEGVNKDGILVKKSEDFAAWYQQVITKAEMIEYYDISGCYILRPNAISIWKQIVNFFDDEITEMGVEPCYFPMFVSKSALEKEESHVEGFSAEVAWVTKSGDSDLQEHIAIRPTSETVMYPSFAKWIRSHRDLPLRLNQWCNVVRWEFSHPTPFIRNREFLWQEGHTAHATEAEATKEVYQVLDLYAQVYEDLLAVPVIKGTKTEKEKFAGGKYTTTVEAFVPTVGRSVQGATSHCLGYGFAEMFKIKYEDKNGELQMPCQNSWGMTTRTIGVMIMVHSDDKGLVIPPKVAPTQCVFVPVGINAKTTPEDAKKVADALSSLHKELKKAGVRSKVDDRDDKTSGFKCNHWEVRGVPVRIEVGPRDVAANTAMLCFRHTGEKRSVSLDGFAANVQQALEEMQKGLFNKAKVDRDERNVLLKAGEWDKFVPSLNEQKTCIVPFCGEEECEDLIKKDSAAIAQDVADEEVDARAPSMGAKSLCIPLDQPTEEVGTKCFNPKCTKPPVKWTLFGRSY